MLNFRVERKQKIIKVTLGVFHYAQNRLAYSHFLFFFFWQLYLDTLKL